MLKWLNYLWNISDGPIIHPSNVWYDDSVFGEGWTFEVGCPSLLVIIENQDPRFPMTVLQPLPLISTQLAKSCSNPQRRQSCSTPVWST